jgi:protein O-mannosyl-transferase
MPFRPASRTLPVPRLDLRSRPDVASARTIAGNLRADVPWPLGVAILAAGTVAIYGRTFSVPFLHDDLFSITANTSIRSLWPIWPVLSPPDEAGVGGRPLLNLSYALNNAAGGHAVWGFHLMNTVIHLLASLTLFGLVRRTLRRPAVAERFGMAAGSLALAVSAIWAFHPVQTESVTYISQRAESLMGLFYLLTLYCFLRGVEADTATARRMWFLLSVLSCLAGAATKEVIVTAPLMVLLYDRAFVSRSFQGAWRRNWRLYLALVAALFPLGHRASGLLHGKLVYGVGFGSGIAWWEYGLTECRVVVKYALLSLWPSPLVFDYGRSLPWRLADVWPYALALASILAAAVAALRRSPALGFAACWFLLILVPTSSVIPLAGEPMAESRLYLPLAAVAALVVLGCYGIAGRLGVAIVAMAAAALAVASAERNRDYESELSIWGDTVSKVPGNARAHGNLAKVLARIPGRLDDAVAEYEEALRLDPAAPELRVNLGNIWFRVPGHMDDAIGQYEEALRLMPDDAQAHFALACALAAEPGRLDESVAQYEDALRLRPDYAAAHSNLGNALLRIPGRSKEAITHYEEALRLKPDLAAAHLGLAMALLKFPGRGEEAKAHLMEVLRLEPGNDEARRIMMGIPAPQS